jgi:hypothetical protein
MTLYLSEILKEFSAQKTRKQKIAFLEKHKDNSNLKFLLQGSFDPNIKWRFDAKKIPKYKPDDAPMGMNPSSLFVVLPKCSIFVNGHPKGSNVTEKKLTELLIQLLESMHADESKLYVSMLKKKLKVKGLTEKLVLEVFPDLYRKV